MPGQYVRRFRMEINLLTTRLASPQLSQGYRWVSWHKRLLKTHAQVKHDSFTFEFDSRVFPCLGEYSGCLKLMREISSQRSFLPKATWLIATDNIDEENEYCATIQGLGQPIGLGAIQNVGVTPLHRGAGLGRALVLKSLRGFREAGMKRVYLEVTADNQIAIDLYRSIGFDRVRTLYKPLQITHDIEAPAFSH